MALSEAARETTRIPLSSTQEFLRLFDQGDDEGPFSARYNIVVGWRVYGAIDLDTLQLAFDDVAARHDSLRTTIVRGENEGYQLVGPPCSPRLEVVDLAETDVTGERDLRVEEMLGDLEAGSYSVRELPHLRGVLGRFDDEDAVLVLIAHHTASDGWSMQLMIRDLAACYARRRGYDVPLVETAPYAEYAQWQRDNTDEEVVGYSLDYWRHKLHGAEILAVPTDYLRSEGRPKHSPVFRFAIPAEVARPALDLSKGLRASPFMLLLAAYNLVLSRRLGSTDVVVPTLTAGRTEPRFQDTVGPFFNFVPLRTDLEGAETFRDVVSRTRTSCLEAMSYEVPFGQILGEAPTLMRPLTEDNLAACAFQVWQFSTVMDRERVGDLEISEVRTRVLNQADGTDIPDGALLTLDIDPSGVIFGNIAYNSNLYTESTVAGLVSDYTDLLAKAVDAPDAPLSGF